MAGSCYSRHRVLMPGHSRPEFAVRRYCRTRRVMWYHSKSKKSWVSGHGRCVNAICSGATNASRKCHCSISHWPGHSAGALTRAASRGHSTSPCTPSHQLHDSNFAMSCARVRSDRAPTTPYSADDSDDPGVRINSRSPLELVSSTGRSAPQHNA